MKAKYNYLIALICAGFFIYDCVVFESILKEPYMVGLLMAWGITFVWHLGLGIYKSLKK